MGRTRVAKATIRELKRRIIISEKRKKRLTDYLQRVNELYEQGKISLAQYTEILQKDLGDNKTLHEWIQDYNLYIRDCERKISQHKREVRKTQIPVVILSIAFIAIILSSIFLFDFSLTGLITQEPIENISEVITTSTIQQQAILNQPVKWTQTITLDEPGKTKISIPLEATDISVNKISETYSEEISEIEVPQTTEESSPSQGQDENLELPSSELGTEESLFPSEAKFSMTGQVIGGVEGGFLTRFFKNIGRMTGFAVQEQAQLQEIEIDDTATAYEIEYQTPAPYSIEENLENGKRIKIIGPETIHYENVLASTELSEDFNIKYSSQVKIHWLEQDTYIPIQSLQDKDADGIYDYIEFIAPKLSEQTFEIIIITKAEHLDNNRNFISDIYNEVKELDNAWSETISDSEYVRVVFEVPLTSSRDITLYPRAVSGTPKIEVYEVGKTEKIAEFTNLNSNEYNKVLLSNLIGEQDTFDLRVVGGDIEIDHIIDPWHNNITNGDFYSGSSGWAYTILATGKNASAGWENTGRTGGSIWSTDGNRNSVGDLYWYQNFEVNSSIINGLDLANFSFCYDITIWFDVDSTVTFNITLENPSSVGYPIWRYTPTAAESWTCYSFDITSNFTTGGAGTYNLVLRSTYAISNDATGRIHNHWDDIVMNLSWTTAADNPPYSQYPGVNDSTPDVGDIVRHNVNWTDDTAMSYATLEVNGTGASCDTWDNVSETSLSAATEWANLTWTMPAACEGKSIGWRQYANDSTGNWNTSTTQSYAVQNQSPTADFGINPEDDYATTSQSVTFELNCTDNANVTGLVLYGNWTGTWHANKTNSSPINGSIWSVQVDDIPEGANHMWGVWCNDSAGNSDWSNTNRTFMVDFNAPSVSDENANETEVIINEAFCLNVTASDALNGINTIYAEVWDTTTWVNYSMVDDGSTSCDGDPGDTIYGVEIVGSNEGLWNYSKVYANDSAGNMNSYDFSDLTVNVTDEPPQIVAVYNITSSIIDGPNEGPSNTNITINFTAYDADGFGNLDDSSAMVTVSQAGEENRTNFSCAWWADYDNYYANYTCNITMWWWDGVGDWTIWTNITDAQSNLGENNTETFYVGTTTGLLANNTEVGWPEISPGTTNQEASEFLLLNNTGNIEVSIEVNATDIVGETYPEYILGANNFSVHTAAGCEGTLMVASTYTTISGASITKGNYTDGISALEELYFCLEECNSELEAQYYSTLAEGSWTIRVFLVAVTAASGRRKKKKKKDNKLIQRLDVIVSELKEMKEIMGDMREKEKISKKEIIEILELRQKENVPVTIFTKELGGLEALCKYMKENLGMSYSEIAKALMRDERTIWTAYNKAIEKQKEMIKAEHTSIFIPISIFNNRNLTILESVVVHLKIKGMKYAEIAKLINRDQRNIQTIYLRAIKKLKK